MSRRLTYDASPRCPRLRWLVEGGFAVEVLVLLRAGSKMNIRLPWSLRNLRIR